MGRPRRLQVGLLDAEGEAVAALTQLAVPSSFDYATHSALVFAGSLFGGTKVVPPKLNSRAIFCMPSVEMPAAAGRTASGTPPTVSNLKHQ